MHFGKFAADINKNNYKSDNKWFQLKYDNFNGPSLCCRPV